MTLPPHRIGDKGQKYEVSVLNYPNDGWCVVGWSDSLESAECMGRALQTAPRAKGMRVSNRSGVRLVEEIW
jgi:hypothetical protein